MEFCLGAWVTLAKRLPTRRRRRRRRRSFETTTTTTSRHLPGQQKQGCGSDDVDLSRS